MGKPKVESKIRLLIKEYRNLQKTEGRANFPGDPYRMKYETLKKRIDNFSKPVLLDQKLNEDITEVEQMDNTDKNIEVKKDENPPLEIQTKSYSEDFVSISDALSRPSIPIQKPEQNEDSEDFDNDIEDIEEVNEFNDGAVIDESLAIDEEFDSEPKQSFLPINELASLIVDLHDHLPTITSRMYAKVIMGDSGTYAEAKLVEKKVRQLTIDNKEIDLSEKERELYEFYSQIEDYKENSKPNEQTKTLLKRAWEIQLRKWGYDNIDVDKHSLAFAYGMLAVQMGLPFIPHLGKIKFRKKKK